MYYPPANFGDDMSNGFRMLTHTHTYVLSGCAPYILPRLMSNDKDDT